MLLYGGTSAGNFGRKNTPSTTRRSTDAILDIIHRAIDRELAANIVTPGQLRGNGLLIPIGGLPTEEPGKRHLTDRIRQSLCGKFLVGRIELDAEVVRVYNATDGHRRIIRSRSAPYS